MRWTSFCGVAVGGDEIEPAASDVHAGVEAEDAVGEGVAVVMVVEEPGVEAGLAQGGLDGGDVHGGDSTAQGGKGGLAWKVRPSHPFLTKSCIQAT